MGGSFAGDNNAPCDRTMWNSNVKKIGCIIIDIVHAPSFQIRSIRFWINLQLNTLPDYVSGILYFNNFNVKMVRSLEKYNALQQTIQNMYFCGH